MRHVTEQGMALVKRFEGFSATVYICPAGFPTIGYGHLLRDGERLILDDGISLAEAEQLLRNDLRTAEQAVLRLINVPLTDGQFGALVSFTYNLGSGALQSSTLRRKLNRREYVSVPKELRRWVWAGGRKMAGLVRRRAAEANLFLATPIINSSDIA
jgi:lysozyme